MFVLFFHNGSLCWICLSHQSGHRWKRFKRSCSNSSAAAKDGRSHWEAKSSLLECHLSGEYSNLARPGSCAFAFLVFFFENMSLTRRPFSEYVFFFPRLGFLSKSRHGAELVNVISPRDIFPSELDGWKGCRII